MICPTGEAKYFCKQGWTALSTNRPTGKSPDRGESTCTVTVRISVPAATSHSFALDMLL
jgi:hypothetical protein